MFIRWGDQPEKKKKQKKKQIKKPERLVIWGGALSGDYNFLLFSFSTGSVLVNNVRSRCNSFSSRPKLSFFPRCCLLSCGGAAVFASKYPSFTARVDHLHLRNDEKKKIYICIYIYMYVYIYIYNDLKKKSAKQFFFAQAQSASTFDY